MVFNMKRIFTSVGVRYELDEDDKEIIRKEVAEDLGISEDKIVGIYSIDEYRDEIVERLKKDYNIPENLVPYINVEKLIDDMWLDGVISRYLFKLKNQHGEEEKVEVIVEVDW